MKHFLSILCITLCLICFPFSTMADTIDSSVDDSSNISIDIGGDNSGDIHIGDGDTTTIPVDENGCPICPRTLFDGSTMELIIEECLVWDPNTFEITTWYVVLNLSDAGIEITYSRQLVVKEN